jgi:hypothetical protein
VVEREGKRDDELDIDESTHLHFSWILKFSMNACLRKDKKKKKSVISDISCKI